MQLVSATNPKSHALPLNNPEYSGWMMVSVTNSLTSSHLKQNLLVLESPKCLVLSYKMSCFVTNTFNSLLFTFSKDLCYKGRHWHEGCFKCSKCNYSLVEKPFAAKDERLLCTECYSNECSSKCFHCKKTIMPGKCSRKL